MAQSSGGNGHEVRGVIFDLFHTLTGRETEATDLPATCDLLGVTRTAWNEALLERSRWRLAGGSPAPASSSDTATGQGDGDGT